MLTQVELISASLKLNSRTNTHTLQGDATKINKLTLQKKRIYKISAKVHITLYNMSSAIKKGEMKMKVCTSRCPPRVTKDEMTKKW